MKAAIDELQQHLKTRVFLKEPRGRQPGELIIEYYNDEQLAGIYEQLRRDY
jgi:hypothetical protein